MKDAVEGYLTVVFDQNPKSVGGALPDDGFTMQDGNNINENKSGITAGKEKTLNITELRRKDIG